MDSENDCAQELELFRTEIESAQQFFYAHLGLHEIARLDARVVKLTDREPLFWITAAGALQSSLFIALGRTFDQSSNHNLDRLLNLAQNNPAFFSRPPLARRKAQGAPPAWLDDYVATSHLPTPVDFRRLRKRAGAQRRVYEGAYRDLRRRFAHREVSDEKQLREMFSRTNKRELEQLLRFLAALYESLWQLYENGRRRRSRLSGVLVRRSGDLIVPRSSHGGLPRRVVFQTVAALRRAAGSGAS